MNDKLTFHLVTETSGATGEHGAGNIDSSLSSVMSNLNESVKSLSNNLKSFQTKFGTIKENLRNGAEPSYAQTTSRMRAEAYKVRSEFLNDPTGKQIQEQRAEANLLRIQTERQKQDLKNDILKRADQYKLSGDTSFAKKLEGDVSESLKSGVNKGVNSSRLAQVFTAIGGAALFVNSASKIFSSQSTAGLAMMQNPYTNGYNYGGDVAGVMQANTQKQNAYVGLGTAGIGGALMMSGNLYTKIAGGVIAAGGQLYNSYNSSETNLKAAATNSFVNNTMNAQSLSATNQAASGLYNQGMSGRRITDVEQPLIIAMSKAAGVYNRNFRAMDKLTDYVSAGNMSIQQGAGLSAAVGFLTKGMNAKQQGSFLDTMKQSFSAYGVTDPASAAANAMLYKQAGMSPSNAAELAARATNLNPGAQGQLTSFFSQNMTSRWQQEYIAKHLFHSNLRNAVTGKGDPVANRFREEFLKAEKTGGLPSPGAMYYDTSLLNLTNLQTVDNQSESRNITSTADQKKLLAVTNQTVATNAQGVTLDKAIGTLNDEIVSSSNKLSMFTEAVNAAASALNKIGTGVGTGQSHIPTKMPATKPMSGNTGARYGHTMNDYYAKNPQYSPQSMMNKFKQDSSTWTSLKDRVKI